ncbi:hypothetical protein DPMN_154948 [Dreissena polymorpha]|uniref:Uncharacterized protein n=1 Tax=Dreissena polymorpha TaxID=45954 RepID=A0A9D4FRT2_DREPO|nr:hypothetical protein DPMN_154948 [Dreissena polymorpha]
MGGASIKWGLWMEREAEMYQMPICWQHYKLFNEFNTKGQGKEISRDQYRLPDRCGQHFHWEHKFAQ